MAIIPNCYPRLSEEMKMNENITNRPDAEDAREEKLSEEHVAPSQVKEGKGEEEIDMTPLPKGMREKVETVEVSTFTPKG
jgi:hypothetical protein